MIEVVSWVIVGLMVNAIIGAIVCALLDTDDRKFYKWYMEAPGGGWLQFIVITFWPVMAYYMVKYKREHYKHIEE